MREEEKIIREFTRFGKIDDEVNSVMHLNASVCNIDQKHPNF